MPRVRVSLVFTLTRMVLLLATVGAFILSRCRTSGVCATLSADQLATLKLAKWLPVFLFVIILLLHYIEKVSIRRSKQPPLMSDVSLHRTVDMAGICVASVISALWYQLPWFYLLVPITHFLFHIGVWQRRRTGKSVILLSPSVARQMVWESQILVSALALWPLYTRLDQIATFCMLAFVIYQIRDWLYTVGILDPLSATYRRVAHWMKLFADWGPIGLRIASVFLLFRFIVILVMVIGSQRLLEDPTPELMSRVVPLIIAVVFALVVIFLMLTFGIAGRVAAIIMLSVSTLSSIPALSGLCVFLLVYLGTGKLSVWTEDKLLTCWLTQDLTTQYPDEENVQALQNSNVYQNAAPLEVPVAWQEPFKLNKALKIVVQIGTLVLVVGYGLSFILSLVTMITYFIQGFGNMSEKLMTGAFPFLWTLASSVTFVYLGLLVFYFVHIIKNTAASSVARVIFGIGIYAMPLIAMPIYYWTYLRCKPPPLWARRTVSVEPTPGDTKFNTNDPFLKNHSMKDK